MKSKLRIIGMGNLDDFVYVIVSKRKGIFEVLQAFIMESMNEKYETYLYPINKRKKKKEISNYVDHHEGINSDGDSRLDLFFGHKKLFMTFKGSKKEKEKFLKVLAKYSEWTKKVAGFRSCSKRK